METNNEIQAYREAILKAMLERKDPEDGYPLILEKDARELLAHLTDQELADGMLFNTPEEVADILMEI
jgi:hypothetical protein